MRVGDVGPQFPTDDTSVVRADKLDQQGYWQQYPTSGHGKETSQPCPLRDVASLLFAMVAVQVCSKQVAHDQAFSLDQ